MVPDPSLAFDTPKCILDLPINNNSWCSITVDLTRDILPLPNFSSNTYSWERGIRSCWFKKRLFAENSETFGPGIYYNILLEPKGKSICIQFYRSWDLINLHLKCWQRCIVRFLSNVYLENMFILFRFSFSLYYF